MVNQFNPTEQEIQEIIERNKTLPQLEKTCYKCGHKPCRLCGDWCDNMLYNIKTQGNWKNYDKDDVNDNGNVSPPYPCCDMECSYE